jgi:hypothetical protein
MLALEAQKTQTFPLISRFMAAKIVQAEWNAKFICAFPKRLHSKNQSSDAFLFSHIITVNYP